MQVQYTRFHHGKKKWGLKGCTSTHLCFCRCSHSKSFKFDIQSLHMFRGCIIFSYGVVSFPIISYGFLTKGLLFFQIHPERYWPPVQGGAAKAPSGEVGISNLNAVTDIWWIYDVHLRFKSWNSEGFTRYLIWFSLILGGKSSIPLGELSTFTNLKLDGSSSSCTSPWAPFSSGRLRMPDTVT